MVKIICDLCGDEIFIERTTIGFPLKFQVQSTDKRVRCVVYMNFVSLDHELQILHACDKCRLIALEQAKEYLHGRMEQKF